jgi:hypothetical protein
LSLAGAQSVVEPPGQLRDLGFEFADALEEIPTAGTRGLVHDAIVPTEAMTGTTRCQTARYSMTPIHKDWHC